MKQDKTHHIEARNESGDLVYFEMPRAAIYYGTGSVSVRDEERIDRTKDKLIEQYYSEVDRSDVLIHDLDDKIRIVNRLRRKGVWV